MDDQPQTVKSENPYKLSVFNLLIWAITITTNFLMLPLLWAFFTLLFVFILLPILDIIILGILTKLLISSGHKNLSAIITGIFEAIIIIAFGLFIVSPGNFVHLALFTNIVNQYTRYQRDKNNDELIQFYALIIFWLVFIFITQLTK